MESAGLRLLQDVPRSGEARAKVFLPVPGEVIIQLAEVEAGFLEAARVGFIRLAGKGDDTFQQREEERRRKVALNQGFDKKVAEEVASDPKVLDLERELEEIQSRTVQIEAERRAKIEDLKAEREPLREAYIFVSDDREI